MDGMGWDGIGRDEMEWNGKEECRTENKIPECLRCSQGKYGF